MKVSPINLDGFQTIESSCPDTDKIHLYTGNLMKSIGLFSIPTVGPSLSFSLYHNSLDIGSASDVGIGWRHSGQARLERASSMATLVEYTDSSGRRADFEKVGSDWVLKNNSLFRNMILSELGAGIWHLRHDPGGDILEFEEQSGTPILARLVRQIDHNDNEIQYLYDGSELVQILEPVSERAITLGWDSGFIASATDPEGNTYLLSYQDDLLIALEMPDGCMIQHTYNANNQVESRTDRAGYSTVYTYDANDRLVLVEGVLEAEVLSSAGWTYPAEPIEEVLSHYAPPTHPILELTQVLFTDARGKTWDFRFLPNSKLWREIAPRGP
jgi:YD repeat-containing protein